MISHLEQPTQPAPYPPDATLGGDSLGCAPAACPPASWSRQPRNVIATINVSRPGFPEARLGSPAVRAVARFRQFRFRREHTCICRCSITRFRIPITHRKTIATRDNRLLRQPHAIPRTQGVGVARDVLPAGLRRRRNLLLRLVHHVHRRTLPSLRSFFFQTLRA